MAHILVTGARRGIGREITLALARAGHDVVATMRDPNGSDLADIATQDKLAISIAALDVDDDASVAALFAQPGLAGVDVPINNASVLSINALEDESIATMQAVMNTNFSSIAGRMVAFSHGAYGPSKFALEAVSEVLAQELGPFGVRVALVEPGIIATDMAVANLPQPRADSAYPSGRRMVAMNADASNGTPPSVVAGAVLDIVSGRNTAFRTRCGDDAALFLGMRARMSDEAWIAMSDTLDDGELFARMTARLNRDGLLIEDSEQPWLDLEPSDTLDQLNAASIRYRIAVGQGAGGRTLTLKNPALVRTDSTPKPFTANRDGFSLNCAGRPPSASPARRTSATGSSGSSGCAGT